MGSLESLRNKKGEQIIAKPFADWLNHQVELADRYTMVIPPVFPPGGAKKVAEMVGWLGESGQRRLYRYRNQLMCGSKGLVKGDRHTDWFPRKAVEDALHMAGVGLWEVYPELVEDIILEPDRFCDRCNDVVTPIDGCCPWDDTVVDLPDHKVAA